MEHSGARPALVYWAAPFFDDAWRSFNLAAAEELRRGGLRVILPQEKDFNLQGSEPTPLQVFDVDRAEILRSHTLVAVLDGPVIDDGVAAELGLAYSAGVRCVGLLTDLRQDRLGAGRLYRNIFVMGLLERSGGVVRSLGELSTALGGEAR